jgi:hypothetical protein
MDWGGDVITYLIRQLQKFGDSRAFRVVIALSGLLAVILIVAGRGKQEPGLYAIAGFSNASTVSALIRGMRARRNQSRIHVPYGAVALGLLMVVFSKKTVERVFEPTIADTRYELFEALRAGDAWYRRFFIQARGYLALAVTVIPQTVLSAAWALIRERIGIK